MKKILSITLVTLITLIVSWGYNQNEVKLSELALENLEALAVTDPDDHAAEDYGDGGGGIDQSGYRYRGEPKPCCEQYYHEYKCSSVWPDC
ncbi:hypothetical protein HHO38_16605 [Parabacteroides distasonis]|uniref:NVEALA family protein n=1 Tax=Parabacteroides distasonis TaxID=823 RepID=A0A7L5EEI6_PARDI|nr:hypothetical protein [Parabacteroides distasonis]QJE29818.1 hypothetical protein HHO38_16605 [Parabacteroides distasonis]WRY45449.1 hypothetical protein P8F78_09810 [Parabacteroides distasonis]